MAPIYYLIVGDRGPFEHSVQFHTANGIRYLTDSDDTIPLANWRTDMRRMAK